MNCNKCQSPLQDTDRFCPNCGAAVEAKPEPAAEPVEAVKETASAAEPVEAVKETAPAAEPVEAVKETAPAAEPVEAVKETAPAAEPVKAVKETVVAENAPKEKQEEKKKQGKKKKGKTGLIVLAAVAAFFLIVGIVAGVLLFPLSVTFDDPKETVTKNGTLPEAQIVIHSNQPILSVKYALNPENDKDLELFAEGKTEGGLFEKTFSLDEMKVDPGESVLHLYVKTLFGEETHKVELVCKVGNISPVEDVVSLNGEEKIARGEIILTVKPSVNRKTVEEWIRDDGGKIVGEIYTLNFYQIRFENKSTSELESIISTLNAKEEEVVGASFNFVEKMEEDRIPNDPEYSEWKVSEPGGNNWEVGS